MYLLGILNSCLSILTSRLNRHYTFGKQVNSLLGTVVLILPLNNSHRSYGFPRPVYIVCIHDCLKIMR